MASRNTVCDSPNDIQDIVSNEEPIEYRISRCGETSKLRINIWPELDITDHGYDLMAYIDHIDAYDSEIVWWEQFIRDTNTDELITFETLLERCDTQVRLIHG